MSLYRIFDTYFRCDMELPFRSVADKCLKENDDIVNIVYNDKYESDKTNVHIAYSDSEADLFLTGYARYLINFKNNEITVFAKSINDFISTFFNIPLSVFFLHRGKILLHSSSIVYDKKLYPFVADKGVGKSTLTSLLIKKGASFFSDDTLLLTLENSSLIAHKSPDIIKLTDETYNIIINDDSFDSHDKNIANKAYINPKKICEYHDITECMNFQSMYKLERYKGNKILNYKYLSPFSKKTLFIGQIVGIRHFNTKLVKMAMSLTDKINFSNIDLYVTKIPSTLEEIANCRLDEFTVASPVS